MIILQLHCMTSAILRSLNLVAFTAYHLRNFWVHEYRCCMYLLNQEHLLIETNTYFHQNCRSKICILHVSDILFGNLLHHLCIPQQQYRFHNNFLCQSTDLELFSIFYNRWPFISKIIFLMNCSMNL